MSFSFTVKLINIYQNTASRKNKTATTSDFNPLLSLEQRAPRQNLSMQWLPTSYLHLFDGNGNLLLSSCTQQDGKQRIPFCSRTCRFPTLSSYTSGCTMEHSAKPKPLAKDPYAGGRAAAAQRRAPCHHLLPGDSGTSATPWHIQLPSGNRQPSIHRDAGTVLLLL